MRIRPPASRPGLSLLEVIIALAVFLLSLVGLGHLVGVASGIASEANQRSQAARLCQSKLDEVVAGSVPLTSQGDTAFDEDPDYHWSLDADQNSTQGLFNVTVRVTRKRPGAGDLTCSISQMVLDPSTLGSTQDSIPPQMSATAASGGSSGGSGGSGGSSGPSAASGPTAMGAGAMGGGKSGAAMGGGGVGGKGGAAAGAGLGAGTGAGGKGGTGAGGIGTGGLGTTGGAGGLGTTGGAGIGGLGGTGTGGAGAGAGGAGGTGTGGAGKGG